MPFARRGRAGLLAVALAVGGAVRARAEPGPGRWSFASYRADQGLHNLANRYIVQTPDLSIWVSSDDGLHRFHGDGFTRVGVSDGLPSSQITLLFAADDGRLWIGGHRSLAYWENERVHALAPSAVPPGPLTAMVTHGGRVLAGTADGLFEETERGQFSRIDSAPGGAVSALASLADGELWLGLGARLLVRSGADEWRELTGLIPFGVASSPTAHRIDRIDIDASGGVWLRTPHRWFHRPPGASAFSDVSRELGSFSASGYQMRDRRGAIWAMTNRGLVEASPSGFRHIDTRQLPTPWIWSMLEDHEGSLWFSGLGVHRALGRRLWTLYRETDGLPNDIVYPIVRGASGALWIGTDTGVGRSGARGFVSVPNTADLTVRALLTEADGGIWFGGVPAFVVHLGADGRQTRYGPEQGVVARRIMALAREPDGRLWVATDGGGLLYRDPGAARFVRQALPAETPYEVLSDVLALPDGRLWVGGELGLVVREHGELRRFGVGEGLRAQGTTVLVARDDGSLCVGYYEAIGASCFRLERDGLRDLTHYDESRGLSSGRVYLLGEDRERRLWIGTGAGVDVFGPEHLEHFGESDGLPGDDCDARAFLAEPDGTVWIGTSTGLARFEGAGYRGPLAPPATRILGATVEGEPRELGPVLLLGPGQQRLGLRFNATSYANPRRVRYQARVDGDAWRTLAAGEVRYEGVTPGEHVFEVRTRIGRGAYGAVASVPVLVEPNWWQRWPLQGLGGLGLVGLAIIAVRWRVRQLARRNRELEELIAARTAELRAANERLTELTLTDPLTGLRNRRYLSMTLPADVVELERRHRDRREGSPGGDRAHIVLLLFDIDHFKRINDRWGHEAGDQVLQQMNALLASTLRRSDVPVRWGGEEFLLVARHTERHAGAELAGRLLNAMRAHRFRLPRGESVQCTCSIGFAPLPFVAGRSLSAGWETVVGLADQCLYTAKRNGRDCWVGVEPGEGPFEEDFERRAHLEFERYVSEGRLRLLRS